MGLWGPDGSALTRQPHFGFGLEVLRLRRHGTGGIAVRRFMATSSNPQKLDKVMIL
jgi:hypothetical protein